MALGVILILSAVPMVGAQALDSDSSSSPGLTVEIIDSPPRPSPQAPMALPNSTVEGDTIILPNVPALDWAYGCSPTSAAMMFGYYDRTGYHNMYTGPTNGGLFPLPTDHTWWGAATKPGSAIECPLSATHQGVDGRTERGHVDDYWVDFGESGNDPYIVNGWTEHTHADCTADFMWTSQDAAGTSDGGTSFAYDMNGMKTPHTLLASMGYKTGGVGMMDFVISRGYTVVDSYNQYILNSYYGNTDYGFTWDEFMAEIDAGRVVMLHVTGHSMVAFGYEDATQTMYIHDTWSYTDHSMTWGGWYGGMQHYGVTVVQLESVGGGPKIVTSCDGAGSERNAFLPGETVYVKGSGFIPGQDYRVWIQHNPINEGDMLDTGDDSSGVQETVTADVSGDIAVTAIWATLPAEATHEDWDIIIDMVGAGEGTYNAAYDGIDDAAVVGFVAPVPELPTIALFGIGLAGILGYVGLKRPRAWKSLIVSC